jgi:formamidopyrimidine-DNA glycosylase
MPELPDLLRVVARLRERFVGWSVTKERVRAPSALRFSVPGNLSLLLGRKLENVVRHGHFVILRFDGLDLAVNPAPHGRFRLVDPQDKDEPSLAFALGFHAHAAGNTDQAGAIELRFLDDKKTCQACLTASGDWKAVLGMDDMGVDILSPQFTAERLVSLLKHRREPVRSVLVDKRVLDSLGNDFADAALNAAGIHPKTSCHALAHEQALRLHGAIVRIVRDAVDEAVRGDEPIDFKDRIKSDCPRCGSKIRETTVRAMPVRFCPRCQSSSQPTATKAS